MTNVGGTINYLGGTIQEHDKHLNHIWQLRMMLGVWHKLPTDKLKKV